jgi:beta-lactamase superfamily II metal-dependent hydrolase
MDYTFHYHFESVGQGLFAWGCIHQKDDRALRFTWVYDCGTTSKQHFVTDAIARYERYLGIRKRIDLLTISHFDGDHISGVAELIKKFKIGTLLLPYTDLKQRLIYAFEHGVAPNSNLMDFYLDPTGYLTRLAGPGIDRILIVPSGNGEGPAMPEGNPEVPGDGNFPPLKFEIDRGENLKESAGETVAGQPAADKTTSVEYLRRSSKLQLPNLWEFVPYNEDPIEGISKRFESVVEKVKTQLLAPDSPKSREVLLDFLKEVYDEEFGDDSYERNVISLSLYSGPIYPSWKRVRLCHYYPVNFNRSVVRARLWQNMPLKGDINRCSILYTGDGYLDTPRRLDCFVNYFLNARIVATGVFQVMHHGAEDNWHKGVAARIAPLFSVFSSDPEHKKYKHPHAPVLHDFWRYGAVQVDKRKGFCVGGWLIK